MKKLAKVLLKKPTLSSISGERKYKNNMKKFFVITGMAVLLGGASTVYAANTFNFSITYKVMGKKEFNLKNAKTTCDSKAATYKFNTDTYANAVCKYRVDLDGNYFWNPDYTGKKQPADDRVHTTHYNEKEKIAKNTYTVNVYAIDDLTARCLQITGNGTLKQ